MSGGGAAGKTNLSKKEIDDILRFGTEELFNQVSWRVFIFVIENETA
jgi:hypothetical protein